MIDYPPDERQVYDAEGATEFLGLVSVRALKRLVESKRLVPLKFGKSLTFARSELMAAIERELANQRHSRGCDS